MHLSGIFIYPVKSLRGLAVESCAVDALGPVGDRRFMVVDPQGLFLSQRGLPRMALVATRLDAGFLTLSAPGRDELRVLLPSAAPANKLLKVTVWKSEGLLADDCGDAPAQWLSDFLGTSARLVVVGSSFHRPVLKPGRARPEDIVGFADLFPFLMVSEASLADLNGRLLARGSDPVPLDRFRTNLLISGCEAFAEDTWKRFCIGSMIFRNGGPCARCSITITDQATAERGPEPLRTLATYRRDAHEPAKVNFAQNVFHETKSGRLRVGDPIELLPDE